MTTSPNPAPTPELRAARVHGFDSDAVRAAVTASAQAVQADAERQGYRLTYEQCEELAIVVISHYQAFVAGVDYASSHNRTAAEQSE